MECQKISTQAIQYELSEAPVYCQKTATEEVYRIFLFSEGDTPSDGGEFGDSESV